jgi:hypothetical protein
MEYALVQGFDVPIAVKERIESIPKIIERRRPLWVGFWQECNDISKMLDALVRGIEVTSALKESPECTTKAD